VHKQVVIMQWHLYIFFQLDEMHNRLLKYIFLLFNFETFKQLRSPVNLFTKICRNDIFKQISHMNLVFACFILDETVTNVLFPIR